MQNQGNQSISSEDSANNESEMENQHVQELEGQQTVKINSQAYQYIQFIIGAITMTPFLLGYALLYYSVFIYFIAKQITPKQIDFDRAFMTFKAGGIIVGVLGLFGLSTSFQTFSQGKIKLKFKNNVKTSLYLIVYSAIIIVLIYDVEDIFNQAKTTLNANIVKKLKYPTISQQISSNLQLIQHNSIDLGIKLIFNQEHDWMLINKVNYNYQVKFYDTLGDSDISSLIISLKLFTVIGLFIVLFFQFNGSFGTTINLVMAYYFTYKLSMKNEGYETFPNVLVPLVFANMVNILAEILFLFNWKAKRNSTASLTRHLYKITDIQILSKMMELTGQILLAFSLQYLNQIAKQGLSGEQSEIISSQAYYSNVFQFSFSGFVLKTASQCMNIGRTIDIIIMNIAYDQYTNYPYVIQQYKARIAMQMKIKENLDQFEISYNRN